MDARCEKSAKTSAHCYQQSKRSRTVPDQQDAFSVSPNSLKIFILTRMKEKQKKKKKKKKNNGPTGG